MLTRRSRPLALSAALFVAACHAGPDPVDVVAPGAPQLYTGYGGYGRPTATTTEAQAWMDQGWQLVYGFNHDEAIRSFREAARIDPDCAMAWWGVAYANGIDVNDPAMNRPANAAAYEASRRALSLVEPGAEVTAAERALIEALAERYTRAFSEDRTELDEAYAAAMGRAFQAHPDDADVAALYAESLMVLQPWDYWNAEGEPKQRAGEIVEVLERGIRADPDHPGANHFYIHAVEASPEPGRAEAAADLLVDLVPGSGHLVHMPSHVYINVGRYDDAVAANERAIRADEAYFATAPAPEFYGLYFLHNVHFLTFAAMMEGRYELSLWAARKLAADAPPAMLADYLPIADGLLPVELHVLVRFGRWEELVAYPEFEERRRASRAVRHYARTVALANLGEVERARVELELLEAATAAVPEDWKIGVNPAADVLAVAHAMAEGELLWRQGDREDAYESLRHAVELEDALVYDEPPGWMQPVRHALGALLLAGGLPDEAEAVYREDLVDNPGNAWGLLGMQQALRAQGRSAEADALAPEVEAAWARADVEPPASCYCGADA